MYYLCMEKNKTELFKHYLLPTKLRHVLVDHIMKCSLPTDEMLEILDEVKPLFKLYIDYGGPVPENLTAFEDIADGDFESALRFIYGEDTPDLSDIRCVVPPNFSIEGCAELWDDWPIQFETIKPDLFVFDSQNRNEEILSYCLDNDIRSVQFDNPVGNLADILDSIGFRYIPDFKHLVVIYRLDDLKSLKAIKECSE